MAELAEQEAHQAAEALLETVARDIQRRSQDHRSQSLAVVVAEATAQVAQAGQAEVDTEA